MQTSESIAKIAPAIVAAQAEIEAAPKSATNPHFRSKYADLSTIIETVRPVLAKHGLSVLQHNLPCDNGILLQTQLLHASGEWIADDGLIVPAAKSDAQATGSALTYARRYALATLLGVPTEDDDGNAAASDRPRSQPRQQSATYAKASTPHPKVAELTQRIKALPDEPRKRLGEWMRAQQIGMGSLTDATAAKLEEAVTTAEAESEAAA